MGILSEGIKLKDVYTVEKYLGEGAFAEVYRVNHSFLGRQAMKVMKRKNLPKDKMTNLLSEAKLLSKIGHPNIVRVFDANTLEIEGNSYGYFTMEYIHGGTLSNYLNKHRGALLPLHTTLHIVKQICKGMKIAHGQSPPIIHRDLKPANILVIEEEKAPTILISDFGLAKKVNPMTLMASAAGTLGFKPPEVFHHRAGDSCPTDVWSIGAIFYLLCTNTLPYKPSKEGYYKEDSLKRGLKPVKSLNPEASVKLEETLNKCLSLNPKCRYKNATELLEALNQIEDYAPQQPCKFKRKETQSAFAKALELKNNNKLQEALNILEKDIKENPTNKLSNENLIKLWKRGVAM